MERIMLLQILPKEGNFVTLKIIRNLQELLSPSEEEFKKYEINQVGERVTWNEKGKEELDIEIGEKARDIVIDALKKLDDEGKLTQQHLSVYEKFVEEK